jgi:hypothetical protein
MAGHTLGETETVKSSFMGAFQEEVTIDRMTLSTYRCDRISSGRVCPVVPVAIVTRRSRKVALHEQSQPMDALLILRKLVRRDVIAHHVSGVRMAAGTGTGSVSGVHRRLRLIHRQDAVDPMAADTGSDLFILLGEPLSVDTGGVLGLLVSGELGVELAHILLVTVAATTELRDFLPCRRTTKPLFWSHGGQTRIRWISPMTVGTGEPPQVMDVFFYCSYRCPELGGQEPVALYTAVLLCPMPGTGKEQDKEQEKLQH